MFTRNATHTMIIQSVLRGYGNIIEEAVAVVFRFHCMMTWWTYNCHAILNVASQNTINQLNRTAN